MAVVTCASSAGRLFGRARPDVIHKLEFRRFAALPAPPCAVAVDQIEKPSTIRSAEPLGAAANGIGAAGAGFASILPRPIGLTAGSDSASNRNVPRMSSSRATIGSIGGSMTRPRVTVSAMAFSKSRRLPARQGTASMPPSTCDLAREIEQLARAHASLRRTTRSERSNTEGRRSVPSPGPSMGKTKPSRMVGTAVTSSLYQPA